MLISSYQDAPKVPPNPISLYGLKRASDDIAALAKEVGASKIILGGHDWYQQSYLTLLSANFVKGRFCGVARCSMASRSSLTRVLCLQYVAPYSLSELAYTY